MNLRLVLKALALFVSVVVLGIVLKTTELGTAFDKAWIDSAVRGKGLTGEVVFLVVGAFFTGLGLPRQVVCFLAGYAFGFIVGSGLALVATLAGCASTFTYARLLGRDLVATRFPARVKRVDDFLSDNPLSMTLLIRFLPVGSNLITNLAAGVSRVSALPFLAGSAIGYVPQTVIFALLGSGVAIDPEFRIGLSAVLFVSSGVLGIYLYRRFRHGHTFDDDLDRELDAPSATVSRERRL
jgi:uncharacterized membrane protein YdjX (TVP38/TMEM64 family)